MRQPWTSAEIKKLSRLYAEGMSREDISKEMGRPWTSIKHVIWGHAMRRNPSLNGFDTQTGVGGFFCAAHRDKETGALHGHTWDVIAWFKSDKNAVTLQNELNAVLKQFDHTELPNDLAWGEAIAAEICRQLRGCKEVQISRQAERIFARCVPRK